MKSPLLFDGAYGTLYAQLSGNPASQVDEASLLNPSAIWNMHERYLNAGAQAIKTCTFSAPVLASEDPDYAKKLITAASIIARSAVQEKEAVVFADLGPVPPECHVAGLYQPLAETFLDQGVTHFLFETLPDLEGICETAKFIRQQQPDAFILVSVAAGSDGLTRSGLSARMLLDELDSYEEVDAMGLNCLCGPSHMRRMMQDLPPFSKPLSFMPNAGYPSVTSRRTIYDGSPDYFASCMSAMVLEGASIVGGCCGTTPDHIEALHKALENIEWNALPSSEEKAAAPVHKGRTADILDRNLMAHKKSILVELDPPANDHVSQFLEDASTLHRNGADVLTIADNPIGRPRADSSILACKVHREIGMDVLPHMTCRDRNLNAIKALLLGLSMEEIHQVLLVTGDPLPLESRDEVRAVFSFNSRTLAKYVRTLEEEGVCQPFHTLGALDVNARNFDIQLSFAKQKEEAGIEGFLTQPVFSKRAAENLKKARSVLKSPIYGGIMPLVSARNANFLKNEITGMDIPDELAARFEGKNREECEAISLEICSEIAQSIYDDVDGFYLMTPFRRISLITSIMRQIQQLDQKKQPTERVS